MFKHHPSKKVRLSRPVEKELTHEEMLEIAEQRQKANEKQQEDESK